MVMLEAGCAAVVSNITGEYPGTHLLSSQTTHV